MVTWSNPKNQAGNHLNQVSLCARFHGTVAGIKRDALTIVDPYKTSAMQLPGKFNHNGDANMRLGKKVRKMCRSPSVHSQLKTTVFVDDSTGKRVRNKDRERERKSDHPPGQSKCGLTLPLLPWLLEKEIPINNSPWHFLDPTARFNQSKNVAPRRPKHLIMISINKSEHATPLFSIGVKGDQESAKNPEEKCFT